LLLVLKFFSFSLKRIHFS